MVFDYTPDRSRDGPQSFLSGYKGYLQADAYAGYDGIYAGQRGGRGGLLGSCSKKVLRCDEE